MLVAVQLSVLGLYLPPVLNTLLPSLHPRRSFRCRSTLPCDSLGQRARWWCWWLSNYPCLGLYLPPVFKGLVAIVSTPDDHFAAGPDCRVISLGQRARWWCWWLSNYRCWDCICRRCSNRLTAVIRPRRSFHCRSTLPCDSIGRGRIGGAGGCPTIRAGIVSAAGVQIVSCRSAPDDHFAAGPDCRVTVSGIGRVGGAGGCPTIGAGIVSAAGVQSAALVISAPDDHFTAGPHCCVTVRPAGALVVLVAVQLSVLGLYLPPVLK